MITILHRGGYGQKITILHRGGSGQMITRLHREGGSAETPKSDYVIYGWPLIEKLNELNTERAYIPCLPRNCYIILCRSGLSSICRPSCPCTSFGAQDGVCRSTPL